MNHWHACKAFLPLCTGICILSYYTSFSGWKCQGSVVFLVTWGKAIFMHPFHDTTQKKLYHQGCSYLCTFCKLKGCTYILPSPIRIFGSNYFHFSLDTTSLITDLNFFWKTTFNFLNFRAIRLNRFIKK